MKIQIADLTKDTEYIIYTNGSCQEMNLCFKAVFRYLDTDGEPFFYDNNMKAPVKYDSKYGWQIESIQKVDLFDIVSNSLMLTD